MGEAAAAGEVVLVGVVAVAAAVASGGALACVGFFVAQLQRTTRLPSHFPAMSRMADSASWHPAKSTGGNEGDGGEGREEDRQGGSLLTGLRGWSAGGKSQRGGSGREGRRGVGGT